MDKYPTDEHLYRKSLLPRSCTDLYNVQLCIHINTHKIKQFVSTLESSAYVKTFSYKDDTMLLNDKKKLWKENQEI